MSAALSQGSVLLIAGAVAAALAALVLVHSASSRSRPSIATHLERDAARKDRIRRRLEQRSARGGHGESGGHEEDVEAVGATLAVPSAGDSGKRKVPGLTMQARLVAPPVPCRDPERTEIDRRQFLNRGILGGTIAGLGFFGAASLAFLYPREGGGFGGLVEPGVTPEEAAEVLRSSGRPYYSGEGRFYVVPFRYADEEQARRTYPVTFASASATGVMAIYQKCAHLGCRVPWCEVSQWFECPCHGTKYNGLGEFVSGPAPRGLSRFAFTLDPDGRMIVDTSVPHDAPPHGTDTPREPEPPAHCVA